MLSVSDAIEITEENRSEWLTFRNRSIGSSDAAAVCGVDPYRAPIDVWQRKLGLAPEQAETEAMWWGKHLEPILALRYRQLAGVELREQLFFVHPQCPWMTATLDGLRDDGRIVEFKTASAWAREWGDEDTDHIPEPYLVQVHHQMAVTGAEVADVAVLIGGQRFKVYTVERDPTLVNALFDREAEFWECIDRRVPPAWGRRDAAFLAKLNPLCAGEVDLEDPDVFRAVLAYEELNEAIKGMEALKKRNKEVVLAALGNHQLGRLPDGRTVKRFLQRMPDRTQTVKAHTRHYWTLLKGEPR